MDDIYTIPVEMPDGTMTTLEQYKGYVMLIVNTASKCGLVDQLHELEALYQEYKDRKFIVLGFPCGQFAGQEEATAEATAKVCMGTYGITFPLFAKIDVNGKDPHPLFELLKHAQKGILDSVSIKWNFTKFLVDRDGTVVARIAPKTRPKQCMSDIEALL